MSRPRTTRTRALALLSLGAAVTLSGIATLGPTTATASSHREAPRIAGLPQYDNTDFYMWVPPDKPDTTTIVANVFPFELPPGGPNFYPFATDARYDIHIDNDGNSKADITLRYTFSSSYQSKDTFLYNTGKVTSLDDPDLNFRQTYKLEALYHDTNTWKVLANGARVAPSNVGAASMPNYRTLRDQAVTSLPGGVKTFAGQCDEMFYVDLRVFDLLYGGDLSEVGDDSTAGLNVNCIALQVPTKTLTDKDPVIGGWSTTSRRNAGGKWVQVSRLGMPLVNEVVIPLRDKDRFNASRPKDDAQFLKYVTNPEVPRLIQAIYGIKAPATPRNDLVQAFLTGVPGLNQPKNIVPSEQLRLNTSIKPNPKPKRLGVLDGDTAGFPNGRRLTDDVLDITLQVAEGELVGSPNDLGDAVNKNDVAFSPTFPYVALPKSGSVPRKAGSNMKSTNVQDTATLVNGGSGPSSTDFSPASSDSSVSATDVVLPAGVVGLGLLALAGSVILWRRYTATA
jgi:hypothetical protein